MSLSGLTQLKEDNTMPQNGNLLVDRYFAALLNEGNFAAAEEILAPHFTFYGPTGPAGRDRQAFAAFIQELRTAFPDKHFAELERIEAGDCIVSRFRMTGTQRGLYRRIPPTGRTIDIEGCDLFYFQDGKIVKVRAYFDLLMMLTQLGVFPGVGL